MLMNLPSSRCFRKGLFCQLSRSDLKFVSFYYLFFIVVWHVSGKYRTTLPCRHSLRVAPKKLFQHQIPEISSNFVRMLNLLRSDLSDGRRSKMFEHLHFTYCKLYQNTPKRKVLYNNNIKIALFLSYSAGFLSADNICIFYTDTVFQVVSHKQCKYNTIKTLRVALMFGECRNKDGHQPISKLCVRQETS